MSTNNITKIKIERNQTRKLNQDGIRETEDNDEKPMDGKKQDSSSSFSQKQRESILEEKEKYEETNSTNGDLRFARDGIRFVKYDVSSYGGGIGMIHPGLTSIRQFISPESNPNIRSSNDCHQKMEQKEKSNISPYIIYSMRSNFPVDSSDSPKFSVGGLSPNSGQCDSHQNTKSKEDSIKDNYPSKNEIIDNMFEIVVDNIYEKIMRMVENLECRNVSINMSPQIWNPEFKNRVIGFFIGKGFLIDIKKKDDQPDALYISW